MKLSRILCSAVLVASAAAPALALDYEAKPVAWVISAPWHLMGATSGALVSGVASGPMDEGFAGTKKGTRHVAGKFGDEKGNGQLVAGSVIGAPAGSMVGGTVGSYHGFKHGWKTGWEHPFSRWSYITMEEK